jgi:hypothetical protein
VSGPGDKCPGCRHLRYRPAVGQRLRDTLNAKARAPVADLISVVASGTLSPSTQGIREAVWRADRWLINT